MSGTRATRSTNQPATGVKPGCFQRSHQSSAGLCLRLCQSGFNPVHANEKCTFLIVHDRVDAAGSAPANRLQDLRATAIDQSTLGIHRDQQTVFDALRGVHHTDDHGYAQGQPHDGRV